MPDKNYARCHVHETGCLRCWRNKLKHGSKQAKAYVIKHGLSMNFDVEGERCGDFLYINRDVKSVTGKKKLKIINLHKEEIGNWKEK